MSQRRILVVGPSWVGDMIMAQTLFRLLKQQQPEAVIDVLAPAWSQPLLARMPEVNQALDLPFEHGELNLPGRRRLGKALAAAGYDQAIVLPNSFKSALLPWFAGIPQRTGWRGEMRGWLLNDCRRLDKDALPLMVQRFAALALAEGEVLPDPLPVPQLQYDKASAAATLTELAMPPAARWLMLCPGAEFGPAKQWPAEHFASVAREFIKRGWHIALLGSARDAEVTAHIAAQVADARCVDLAGRTRLDQAIDVLACASAVVSNDSGLMHVAAALHKPLVALYGSTSPDFTPPLTDRVAMLHTDIDCRPCFKRECPLQHKRCLTELLPAQVVQALMQLQTPLQAQQEPLCIS